jgi:hypothetical protein
LPRLKRHWIQFGKPVLAGLLAGLIFVLGLLAASPELHRALHKDADRSGHQCAITLFAQSQVDSANCDVSPVDVVVFCDAAPVVIFSVFSSGIENLPAGRAPPAVISA